MSERKTRKSRSTRDHKEENEMDIDQEVNLVEADSDVITKDVQLRNLFQLGYNSRALTKQIVNSIKLDDALVTIKNFIESGHLSVKNCGPLLLGLIRVYFKKIKIYTEEVESLFNVKKEGAKKKKVEEAFDKTKDRTLNTEANTFFNQNVLSLSMVSDSNMYSMLHDKTPIKTKSESIIGNSTTPVAEVMRAGLSTDSKQQPLFNFNSEAKQNILAEEDQIKDVNNFFQFISENIKTEQNLGNADNLDFGVDLNLELSDLNFKDLKTEDDIKKINFSESKLDLTKLNTSLNLVTKASRVKKINPKLEYDEVISTKLATFKPSTETSETELSNMLKEKIRKEENMKNRNFLDEGPFLKSLLDNLNSLNLNDEELIAEFKLDNLDINSLEFPSITNIADKLNKIIEEENKQKEEFNLNNLDNLNEFNERVLEHENEQEEVKKEIEEKMKKKRTEVCEKILSRVQKDKKINFVKLNSKLENEIESSEIFYNLLCLAQHGDIELTQSKLFQNDSIQIVKI